jgi:D-3-phosphoglycerate dehydrogenase
MTKEKVLVFEEIHPKGIDYLREQGCEVVFPESLDDSSLLKAAADVEGILVRTRGMVSRELMLAAPRLKVVGRHGVGLETIDVEAATELGIQIVNTPHANAESVAEHFLVLALMLSKRIPQTTRALLDGDWSARGRHLGREFYGKTVGIIGFGRVGQAVARICRRAFDSKVLYHSRGRNEERETELGVAAMGLDELLRESDFVAVCLPLTRETEGFVGLEQLALMKPSAFVVNVSNGRVWREADVFEALRGGRIAGAATDVFEREPAMPDNPLFGLDNFLATPHNAAQTEESLQRMAMVAEDIVRVIRGLEPLHPVNRPAVRL